MSRILNLLRFCRLLTLGALTAGLLFLTSSIEAAAYTLAPDPDFAAWQCDTALGTLPKAATPTLNLHLITYQLTPAQPERYSFLCLNVESEHDLPVRFSDCYFTADDTPVILTAADWMTETGLSQTAPTANCTFWTTQWISLSEQHWQQLKTATQLSLNGKINDLPFRYVFSKNDRQVLCDYYRDLIEKASLQTSNLTAALTAENRFNERVESCTINEPVVLHYVLTNNTPILRPFSRDANPVEFEVSRTDAPPLYSGTAAINSTLHTVQLAPFSSWHYSITWANTSGTANSRATLSAGRYRIRAIPNLASDCIPAQLLEPNEVTIQICYER